MAFVWEAPCIFLAAFCAGMVNSIAGGGTLMTFPTLLWIGRDPIVANVTNTVALWPGALSAVFGYRRELADSRSWTLLLTMPSILGGLCGAALLLRTSSRTFAAIVPYLILFATVLFALQESIARWLGLDGHAPRHASRAGWIGAVAFQFCVSVYGGYFGAGMGILMLAALGVFGLTDIHQMNAVKNICTVWINMIAAAYFVVFGTVIWRDAVVMAVAAIAGGYFGAGLARRLGRQFVRRAVVVIGVTMAVSLYFRR